MNKLSSLIQSRRFWLAIGGVAAAVASIYSPVIENIITEVVALISAWIIGDSVRQTSTGG